MSDSSDLLAHWWRERAANSDMKKHISICLYRSLFCLNFPIPLPIPLSLHPSLIAFLSSPRPPPPFPPPLSTPQLSSWSILSPSSLGLSPKASGFSSWCILPPGVSLVHRLNWLTVCLFLSLFSPTTHTHTHTHTQTYFTSPTPASSVFPTSADLCFTSLQRRDELQLPPKVSRLIQT